MGANVQMTPVGSNWMLGRVKVPHLHVHHVVNTDGAQLPELRGQLLSHRLEEASYGVSLTH